MIWVTHNEKMMNPKTYISNRVPKPKSRASAEHLVALTSVLFLPVTPTPPARLGELLGCARGGGESDPRASS